MSVDDRISLQHAARDGHSTVYSITVNGWSDPMELRNEATQSGHRRYFVDITRATSHFVGLLSSAYVGKMLLRGAPSFSFLQVRRLVSFVIVRRLGGLRKPIPRRKGYM